MDIQCAQEFPRYSVVSTRVQNAFLCDLVWLLLCTQKHILECCEHKSTSTILSTLYFKVVEALTIWFGYSHYTWCPFLANWASIKDSIYLKSALKNFTSNSVLIVEAKAVKSWITENIANFQTKLISRLIYCNQFYKVWKFNVSTTKLRNFIKVWKLPISILFLPLKHWVWI